MLAGASRRFPSFSVTEIMATSIPTTGRGGASPSGVLPSGIGGIMFGRIKHLATFGLSALSLGLALLAVSPRSAPRTSIPVLATAAWERHLPRPWTVDDSRMLPCFDEETDPSGALFELAGVHPPQVYYQ